MFTPGDLILDQTYRIDGELGRGAFGVVYRVTHLRLNVIRAMKVLRSDDDGVGSSVFGDYRNRFRLEAQLAARLTHPHVIQVYDFQEQAGVLFCVMEYAPGGSLADLLAKAGPQPVERTVQWLLDAAAGLEALHDQLDAVHRDVKPANLLLDRQGRVKVADLGLAQVGGLGLSGRSAFGSMAPPHPGTPNYASPEHKEGGEPLGPTADVYGLGCVAFELLTGQLWKSARRKVKRPSNLRPDLSPWLDAAVVRMLCQEPGLTVDDADDPAKRYVDMDGVQAALRAGAEQARMAARAAEQARQEAAARAAEEKRKQEAAEQERQRVAAEQARQEAAARAAEEKRRQEAAEQERQDVAARAAEEERRQEAAEQERQRAAAEAARRPQSTPICRQIGIELVQIPAGEFLYGEDKERVRLDAYAIAKTPVTNRQYKAFVDATGHQAPSHWQGGKIPAGKQNHPVVYVSWDDAQAFCQWAGVALPSERKWEKAARGTDGRAYPWGDAAPDKSRCNFNKDVGDTTPVGNYPAGANGLLDMAGNVWEWCADWSETGKYRVRRGGSWYTTYKDYVSCACRGWPYPDNQNGYSGFRVVFPDPADEAAARAVEEKRRQEAAEQERRQQNIPIWQQIGIELVQIPAGEFLYGYDKKGVKLDAFAIAKTPVTNQQYKAFVDATGHRTPSHWTNGKIPAGKEQHPVVLVSWDDAQVFCKWAGVALPTEQQWEKAARGTDGRTYPWGNEGPDKTRCNFNSDVGATTPVGKYPAGANGLLDMAGNVWEWCADWDSRYNGRVIRGGSWYNVTVDVRCASRLRSSPGYRNDSFGFRVVSPGS